MDLGTQGTSLTKKTYNSEMELLEGPRGRSKGNSFSSVLTLTLTIFSEVSPLHPLQKTLLLYAKGCKEHVLAHSDSSTIHVKVRKNGC